MRGLVWAWLCAALLGRAGTLAQDAPTRSDARTIYVSSSMGDDASAGTSADQPKRTLAAARAMLRDAHPDRLLLRRGDVWDEPLGGWRLSGAGEAAPMVIASYGRGDRRPLVRAIDTHAFSRDRDAADVSHLAIVGVRFETQAGDSGASAFWWLGGGRDIRIEDCAFDGGANGVVLQQSDARLRDVRVTRSIVQGVGSRFGHSQGLYAWGVDGLLVESSVFIGGEGEVDLRRNQICVGTDNSGVVIRENLIVRSPGGAISVASGGVIRDNVIARCPRAIQLGGGPPDPITHTLGVSGEIVANIILDCDQGVRVENIGARGALIKGNVLVRGGASAITLGGDSGASGVGRQRVRIRGNIVRDWAIGLEVRAPGIGRSMTGNTFEGNQLSMCRDALIDIHRAPGGVTFEGNMYDWSEPEGAMRVDGQRVTSREWVRRSGEDTAIWAAPRYEDAGRSLATYNASVGGAGTLDALLSALSSAQGPDQLNVYSPAAIGRYFRSGFGLVPTARALAP